MNGQIDVGEPAQMDERAQQEVLEGEEQTAKIEECIRGRNWRSWTTIKERTPWTTQAKWMTRAMWTTWTNCHQRRGN